MESTAYPGYQPYPAYPYATGGPGAPPPPQTNGLAIAALVLGILALLSSWLPFVNVVSVMLAVVGIILGIIGLVQAKRLRSGRVMAGFGVGTSVAAIVLAAVIDVLVGNWFVGVGQDLTDSRPIPAASHQQGEEFSIGDVAFTLTGHRCDTGPVIRDCTATFTVRDDRDSPYSFDSDTYVHAIVDGRRDYVLDSATAFDVMLDPGESRSFTVRFTLSQGERLEGIEFNDSYGGGDSEVVGVG